MFELTGSPTRDSDHSDPDSAAAFLSYYFLSQSGVAESYAVSLRKDFSAPYLGCEISKWVICYDRLRNHWRSCRGLPEVFASLEFSAIANSGS